MDHGAMNHGAVDHSAMNHGGMDHGAMNHDHGAMDHSAMDHAAMDHAAMNHGSVTPHSMMMAMTFHGGYEETILFDFWRISTVGGLVGRHSILPTFSRVFLPASPHEHTLWLPIVTKFSNKCTQYMTQCYNFRT